MLKLRWAGLYEYKGCEMKYVTEDVHLLSANYYSKPMVVKAEKMYKWDKIPF